MNQISDQHAEKTMRAELSRAVAMSTEMLDAQASHAGHRASAEWLAALIGRSQAINSAARTYLEATEPARATA